MHLLQPILSHIVVTSCAVKSLAFALLKLPVTVLYGQEVEITFFICERDGHIVLGNNVIHK